MWTIVTLCARIVLVFILVPAVGVKLGQTSRVSNAITKWRIVPRRSAVPLSRAVVLGELAVLLTLSTGIGLRFGAFVAVLLFGVIAAGAELVVLRGISTACNCFSLDGTERVTHITAIRAAVVAALASVLAYGSDWSLLPSTPWSPALLVFTIPLWIALVRRGVSSGSTVPLRSSL